MVPIGAAGTYVLLVQLRAYHSLHVVWHTYVLLVQLLAYHLVHVVWPLAT